MYLLQMQRGQPEGLALNFREFQLYADCAGIKLRITQVYLRMNEVNKCHGSRS